MGPEGAWRVCLFIGAHAPHGRWARFSSGARGRARYFASFLLSVLTTVVPDCAVCVVTRRFGLALPTPHEDRSSLLAGTLPGGGAALTTCNMTQCMETRLRPTSMK